MSGQALQLGLKKRKLGSDPEPVPIKAGPPGNRLLAGYLAHEFLTHGTLLGQRWDQTGPTGPTGPVRSEPDKPVERAYADVTRLLKTEGAHIPGIVKSDSARAVAQDVREHVEWSHWLDGFSEVVLHA